MRCLKTNWPCYWCLLCQFGWLMACNAQPNATEKAIQHCTTFVEKYPPGLAAVIFTTDTILFHHTTGASIHDSSTFRIASLSKQFTAAAVYALIAEGQGSLETTIGEALPELLPAWQDRTLRELLQHTAGLPDYEAIAPQGLVLYEAQVLASLSQPSSLQAAHPRGRFRYNNTAYVLLSIWVERIAQMPFEQYLQLRFFEPWQMQHSSVGATTQPQSRRVYGYYGAQVFDQSLSSRLKGDGCVYTSALDYSRWLQGLMQEGRLLEEMLAETVPTHLPQNNYGAGWYWQENTQVAWHQGNTAGFSAYVYYAKAEGFAVCVLSNQTGSPTENLAKTLANWYRNTHAQPTEKP